MQGCDASVILFSRNGTAEKDNSDNLSLAGDGFDTVIKAKKAVDSVPRCRHKVSCADILALATRDVVRLVKTLPFSMLFKGIYPILLLLCVCTMVSLQVINHILLTLREYCSFLIRRT